MTSYLPAGLGYRANLASYLQPLGLGLYHGAVSRYDKCPGLPVAHVPLFRKQYYTPALP